MLPSKNGYEFDKQLPTKYWNNKTRIEYLQRRVLVYSYLYYNLSISCITDKAFDCISKQLVQYQSNTPVEIAKQTQYYYIFKNFDGTTGFDLFSLLKPKHKQIIECIALQISNRSGGK